MQDEVSETDWRKHVEAALNLLEGCFEPTAPLIPIMDEGTRTVLPRVYVELRAALAAPSPAPAAARETVPAEEYIRAMTRATEVGNLLVKRAEKAEAEVERLREALREFLVIADNGLVVTCDRHAADVVDMARAALAASPEPGAATIDDVPSCGSENDWRKGSAKPATEPSGQIRDFPVFDTEPGAGGEWQWVPKKLTYSMSHWVSQAKWDKALAAAPQEGHNAG